MTLIDEVPMIEEERSLRLLLQQNAPTHCRFCQCTEFTPCSISIAEDQDGTLRLARNADEIVDVRPCSWYLDGVCNAPRCIEKLLQEWGSVRPAKVLLFDASGRLLMNAEDRLLDEAADDRDFNMIGAALGLKLEEISRELILERIRELREGGRRRRTA
jgi:hypothetical protein